MDNPSENAGDTLVRKLGWMIVGYLLEWPFMCHAGLVLLFTWIASYSHLNVALVCTLGFIYLYQIENRQREKLNWKIRYEERRKTSKMRLAEGETVRWMNQALETVWPIFLGDFASQVLLVPLTSFLHRFKPWSAKKMFIQNLSLGKTPPIVTMVRILDHPVDGDDLAIEASLEWMAAKDMVAVVAVQVRRRIGLGIWTTFHICNLRLEGKVKVGIKFKDGWPVIERVRVCFATAPYMQMTAHPLYNYGVDVTELPGIAHWIDRLVSEALAQSLVEPNMIEIDMEKLMRDVMRPQGDVQLSRGDWCSMRGSPPVAFVIVEVLEAKELVVGDINGYSDPYVKATLGLQVGLTKVKWKTLNPKWNETIKFFIVSWEQPNLILLNVRDKDHFYDDRLGYCIVDIAQYRDGQRHDIWYPLNQVKTGEIHLAITIVEKQTDSQSSEDTSNLNSTTSEMADQPMSQEFDRSVPVEGLPLPSPPGGGRSQPPVASPKDRVSARQRLKSFRSGEALLSDPAPLVDSPNSKVGRQRSGLFGSSKSSRKLEMPQVGPDKGKYLIPGGDSSDTFTSGEVSRPTSTRSFTQMEAEVGNKCSDDTTKVIDVGFGEHGAVKVCQLGDIQPSTWPSQEGLASKRSEDVLNSEQAFNNAFDRALSEREALTNVEEDGGAARKLRSAGLRLHGKMHRAKKGFQRDADPFTPSDSHQDLQTRRELSSGNGALEHLTLESSGGQPVSNSPAGLPLGYDSATTTSLRSDQDGEVMDAGTGNRDSDKHHTRNKAKGIISKAAGQLGHQFSKRMNRRKSSLSSEEFLSSGELTSMGLPKEQEQRSEVPLSGSGANAHTQQPASNSNQYGPPPSPALNPSAPPDRPPPGLPQPVAPAFVQTDNVQCPSPEPLRPAPA